VREVHSWECDWPNKRGEEMMLTVTRGGVKVRGGGGERILLHKDSIIFWPPKLRRIYSIFLHHTNSSYCDKIHQKFDLMVLSSETL
jgi:hypothetical protein